MLTRLVIAEDYEPVQYLLRRLLEPSYDVAAVVGDGRVLLEAVEKHCPDVVLLDISMPLMNGITAARHLRKTHPEMKILFISAHEEKVYRDEALNAGANGYLLKSLLERDLLPAVACVVDGRIYGYSECSDK
jgi:DNA-binding NarL/FixJ family response regulator